MKKKNESANEHISDNVEIPGRSVHTIEDHQEERPKKFENFRRKFFIKNTRFNRALLSAPETSATIGIIKWSTDNANFEYSQFPLEKNFKNFVSKKDLKKIFLKLKEKEEFRSPRLKKKCMDFQNVLIFFGVLFFSVLIMAIGGVFGWLGLGIFVIGLMALALKGGKILFEKYEYQITRQKIYREILEKLNFEEFERKGFRVELGRMAAWLEIHLLEVQELDSQSTERRLVILPQHQTQHPQVQPTLKKQTENPQQIFPFKIRKKEEIKNTNFFEKDTSPNSNIENTPPKGSPLAPINFLEDVKIKHNLFSPKRVKKRPLTLQFR